MIHNEDRYKRKLRKRIMTNRSPFQKPVSGWYNEKRGGKLKYDEDELRETMTIANKILNECEDK